MDSGYLGVSPGDFPLASPVLTGNPTAPTAPLFDSDATLATTEYVQKSLGNKSGHVWFTEGSSLTMTPEDCGRFYSVTTTVATTVTLPLASECPPGAVISINKSVGTPSLTIVPSGSNTLSSLDASVGNIVVTKGRILELMRNGNGGGWAVCGGDAALADSNVFQVSKASTGYQRLPSGLILQWGTVTITGDDHVVAFPTSFVNNPYAVFVGVVGFNEFATGAAAVTQSSFAIQGYADAVSRSISAPRNVNWMAIGV